MSGSRSKWLRRIARPFIAQMGDRQRRKLMRLAKKLWRLTKNKALVQHFIVASARSSYPMPDPIGRAKGTE